MTRIPRALRLLALPFLLAVLIPEAAVAHRLKVFAAVDGGAIAGYAFFVGGGRPKAVPFAVKDAQGETLMRGLTDDEGAFRWQPPGAADYTVIVNAEDGHVAEARLPAARFDGAAPAPAEQTSPERSTPTETEAVPTSELADLVAGAVRHEMLPVLERIEAMDSRMRLTDVVSGLFLILGGAGGALWLSSRKSRGGRGEGK